LQPGENRPFAAREAPGHGALAATGAAYCWGDNGAGQLGSAAARTTSAPITVSGSLTFRSLSAGRYLTRGLTQSGAANCWGLLLG
jgi:alpha-tubulin suppressor-like RCC1 family protein